MVELFQKKKKKMVMTINAKQFKIIVQNELLF